MDRALFLGKRGNRCGVNGITNDGRVVKTIFLPHDGFNGAGYTNDFVEMQIRSTLFFLVAVNPLLLRPWIGFQIGMHPRNLFGL